MVRYALLPAALLLSLVAASAATFTTGAALAAPSHLRPTEAAATLSARAGLGGIGRPGRWLPVDITLRVEPGGAAGVLRVEWGDAVALRDIDIAAGVDVHVIVLLRAIAASPTVRVTLTSGTTTTSSDVPVELASIEAPLTLCIGDTGSIPCSVRITEDAAPANWRGLDLADTVVWPGSATSARRDATRALTTWRAMRWLGDSGPADPVLPPFDASMPAVSGVLQRIALFGIAVVLLTAGAAWWRARVVVTVGVPALVGLATGLLMSNTTVLGQRHAAAIQMTGVVHQFDGASQAVLSAKADIEHASAAPLTLQPMVAEASLATSGSGTIRQVSTEDRDGRAVYRATAGLGARRRVTLEATIAETWIDVGHDGARRTITNRAPFALEDCRWRGSTAEAIGALPPAARVVLAPRVTPSAGDSIVCALPGDWLEWAPGTTVQMRGRTYLVFHFWTVSNEGETHAER